MHEKESDEFNIDGFMGRWLKTSQRNINERNEHERELQERERGR